MSRLKSAPGAKPAKAAKPARPARSSAAAGGARGVYVQSPKSDIYVVLLGIAFGAILLGCLLLLVIMYGYNFQLKPTAFLTPDAGKAPLVAQISEKIASTTTVLL